MVSKPELLGNDDIALRLQNLLSATGLARLAVAFWGRGAVNRLGLLHRAGATRVLCDLFSGGCNPDEIKELLRPRVEVRYMDRLHAKLYCTRKGVVVGSSNASANGLGYEGEELSGNIELNVLVKELSFRKEAEEWFDRLWDENDHHSVDEEVAESARPAWNGRRALTLLKALAADPESFRAKSIRVLVYDAGALPDDVQLWFENTGMTAFTSRQVKVMRETGLYDFYSDATGWPVQPGAIYLDFHWGRKNARPSFLGIWRVRDQGHWDQTENGTRIITCFRMTELDGLRFPHAEQMLFCTVLKTHLQSRSLWGQNTEHNHYNYLEVPLLDFWSQHSDELKHG
jgi:hypothetical protein